MWFCIQPFQTCKKMKKLIEKITILYSLPYYKEKLNKFCRLQKNIYFCE